METIFGILSKNLSNISERLNDIGVEAMVKSKETIIDLNVSNIQKGLTNKDQRILPGYSSESYAKAKKAGGSQAPFGTPDLTLEGDFLGSVYAEGYKGSNPESDGLFINSSDSKTKKLETKYDHIWGVSPKNEPEMNEEILETMQKDIIDGLTETK